MKTNYIDDQLQAGEEDPAVIKQHHIGGKENASPWECDDQEENVTNADEEAMINKILQPWRVTGVKNVVYLLQLFFFPTTSPDILCFV